MSGQFGMDEAAQLRVNGGQHFGQLLDLGYPQPSGGQRLGHLQADIAGTYDDGAGRGSRLQGLHDCEGVAHGVQQMHAIFWTQGIMSIQTADRRSNGNGPGADD